MQRARESLGGKPLGAVKAEAGLAPAVARAPDPPGSGAHRRPIPFHAVVGFE